MSGPTLTDLFPDIFQAMDKVSREPIGLLRAVSIDANMDRAAKNQDITSFVAPAATASDFTPGQLAPNSGDQTIGNVKMTISKERYVPIRWDGNSMKRINSSFGHQTVYSQQVEQAIRTLVNEMEADLGGLYVNASRAVSPSGTTLFDAANYNDVANVRKELVDNGSGAMDLNLVLDTSAGAALRGNAQYAGANTAGREDIVRTGTLLDVHNMSIKESSQVQTHTKGTGTGYLVNSAALAVGDTTIPADTGSGTIVAGDTVTFAGDANEYVVATALSGGSFTIAAPGLLAAPADNAAITVGNSSVRNMAFRSGAIHLATRMLAMPGVGPTGDAAIDVANVTDPISGITFEIRRYVEVGQVVDMVSIAWGYKVIKPEHVMLLKSA